MNYNQLQLCTRVYRLSLIYTASDGVQETALSVNTRDWKLYAYPQESNGVLGNCVLISDNVCKMEYLNGLLWLAGYDHFYHDYPNMATIELIGSDGHNDLCSSALFVRVNGQNPDKMFRK